MKVAVTVSAFPQNHTSEGREARPAQCGTPQWEYLDVLPVSSASPRPLAGVRETWQSGKRRRFESRPTQIWIFVPPVVN